MARHRLSATQRLGVSLPEAWAFFSNPSNLPVITPPWMGFEIISPLPQRMHPGLRATYRVRPLLGVPVLWVSEITVVEEPYRFVDEQRRGPYRLWRHEHRFRAIPGGVEIADDVDYELPFGPAGDLINALSVRRQLQRIFGFRRATLERMFGEVD